MASCLDCIHFNPCNMNGNIIVEKSADSNDWVLHNNVGNNCKYYTPVMEISEMFKGKEARWRGSENV